MQDSTLYLVNMSLRGPLGCDSFSNFPCLWWLWWLWEVLVRYSIKCSSTGICLIFFSWIDWGYEFLREDHGGKMLFLWNHIKGIYYQTDLSLMMITLNMCLTWWWPGFSTVKLLFPFHFLYCTLWKEVPICRIFFKERSYIQTCWRWSIYINYLQILCIRYLFLSPIYLYIQSLIYIVMNLWIFILLFRF